MRGKNQLHARMRARAQDSGDSIYAMSHGAQFGINVTDFPVADGNGRTRRSRAYRAAPAVNG